MSRKCTIDDVDVRGRHVLVRLDLNVPLSDDLHITNDRRIRAALPTIRNLCGRGGRLILISHLGRPTGDPQDDKRYTLSPVASRLSGLLDQPVAFVEHTVGQEVQAVVESLGDGQCCLLENLRFHAAETIKDSKAADDDALRQQKNEFARSLADLADCYVNDAFGTCHRDNASMLTVPQLMAGKPRVIGFLVQKELQFLGDAVANPKRPFVCVLGGAKVSDKVGTIEALLTRCDAILIGGAMAYTFAAAAGMPVGRSLVEREKFELAREIQQRARDTLHLPVDSVAAAEIQSDSPTQVCAGPIPDGLMGLDIGPKTIEHYSKVLLGAGTIVWNGPMGVFETPPFDAGTVAVAKVLADATDGGAMTIVGGGDSAAAVEVAGLADRVSHVSTGGGASIEFLEGKEFAALEVLDDA